jgi:hypothetical protein
MMEKEYRNCKIQKSSLIYPRKVQGRGGEKGHRKGGRERREDGGGGK